MKVYPSSAKDSSGRSDSVQPVAVVGFYGETEDDASGMPLGASEEHIGSVSGIIARPSASVTRPADTTAYAIGDLVADSTTAGSVVPMQFAVARIAGASGMIRRMRLRKTGTAITGAVFRLHLYSAAPTPSNGDNGAWLTNGAATYIGSIDVTMDKVFTDGASGNGVPTIGSEINFKTGSGTILYGLLEARGVYTPASGESFTCILEVLQN